MKNYFLVAELILVLISAIVIYRKIKCSRNCGNCKKYDNIDNIRVEESGHMDVGWNVDSILTKEYVITPIINNRKLFFKKESIFETQKTTAMLKKYCPEKFPKTKGKNKKHSKKKG